MLEDHAADFSERSSPSHGVYGEYDAESIHNIFRLLKRTYCSMQPATIRLQCARKEHYRLVHPDAKALKPVILKKRESDIQREKIPCYHKSICLNLLYESNNRLLLRQYCFYASNIQCRQETMSTKVPF